MWNPLNSVEGEYWCVREDLAASRTLVTPKALQRDPVNAANKRFVELNGIIVLGIAYEYIGNNTGFDLISDDEAFQAGVSRQFTIWRSRAPAVANSLVLSPGSLGTICVPLSPADVLTTPVSGASLKLVLSGAPVGWIMVWGVHGTMAGSFPDAAMSGSPVTF